MIGIQPQRYWKCQLVEDTQLASLSWPIISPTWAASWAQSRLPMWDPYTTRPRASRWTHVGCPCSLLGCLHWTHLGFLCGAPSQIGHRHEFGSMCLLSKHGKRKLWKCLTAIFPKMFNSCTDNFTVEFNVTISSNGINCQKSNYFFFCFLCSDKPSSSMVTSTNQPFAHLFFDLFLG